VDTIAARGCRAEGARADPGRSVPLNGHQATVTKWSRWKDRKKKIDWPLFPGYCFARFDLNFRLAVLNRTGVVNIVSFNTEAAPIPDVEIDSMRQLIETDLHYDPCPMIKEGMIVEVVNGPLKGVVGRLVREGPHSRFVISVELDQSRRKRRSGCSRRQAVLRPRARGSRWAKHRWNTPGRLEY
jgi:transcription antitermination factor NusG